MKYRVFSLLLLVVCTQTASTCSPVPGQPEPAAAADAEKAGGGRGEAVGAAAATPEAGRSTAVADTTWRAGDAALIEWRGDWYPGRITVVEAGRYRIRYDGWGESWDEWVTTARLRRPGTPEPKPAAADTARSAASAATAPPPAPRATPPAQPGRPGAGAQGGTVAAAALHGTWRYESWIAGRTGRPAEELMDGNVFYWLTLRANGTWTLSNTTRWSPNSPDFIAGGQYTYSNGQLVLTQSGTPARVYGRYTLTGTADRLTLRDEAGDMIVVVKGRT